MPAEPLHTGQRPGFAAAFGPLAGLLAVVDVAGRPLLLTDRLNARLGLAATAEAPANFAHLSPEWAARRLHEVALPAAARTGLWHGETAFFDANGVEVAASQAIVAVRDLNDEVACFQVILHERDDAAATTGRPGPTVSGAEAAEAGLQLHARLLEAVGQSVTVVSPEGLIIYWNPGAERLFGWRADEVIGRDVFAFTGQEQERDQFARLLELGRAGQRWTGEVVVTRKDGTPVGALLSQTPVLDEHHETLAFIALATDITELSWFRERERHRAVQQAATSTLGQVALDADDVDSVLQRACEIVAETLEVELTKVLELTADEQWLRLRDGVGWHDGLVGSATLPNDPGSQAGYALSQHGPVTTVDIHAERRFAPAALLTDHGAVSGMSVVIRTRGRAWGLLGAHTRVRRAFDDDDVAFLQTVANMLGTAIERHDAQAELQRMALEDSLTGLANRTLFLNHLRTALVHARGRPATVGVLFIDLDRFKLVNEALGHVAGDDLLRTVAQRLTEAMRDGDVVARLGGDEFAVLCQGLSGPDGAAEVCVDVAERLRAAIAPPMTLGSLETSATASVGIALNTSDSDAESLLRDADTAMYRAKHERPQQIDVFDEALRDRAFQRLGLINALRSAEADGRLRLHYQPEFDLRTGQLFGYEALLRWDHPERGLVAPNVFIGLAEETGLIVPIGRWVLHTACAQAMHWARLTDQRRPPPMAVNVSRRQLVCEDFADEVAAALSATGLPADSLYLEITESAVIDDATAATRTLGALSDLGVRIAIDDFGTGYSSLESLRTFTVDILKIDRGFVAGLAGGHESDRMIVQATVGLADALDMLTVAEGVETDEQLAVLQQLGCDVGQGYRWCKPMPPDAVERWIAETPQARSLSSLSAA